MDENLDHLDISNFASEHAKYSTQNKCPLGKCKSEMELSPPKEFVGLRVKAKMHRMHIPSAPSKSQQKVKGFFE